MHVKDEQSLKMYLRMLTVSNLVKIIFRRIIIKIVCFLRAIYDSLFLDFFRDLNLNTNSFSFVTFVFLFLSYTVHGCSCGRCALTEIYLYLCR